MRPDEYAPVRPAPCGQCIQQSVRWIRRPGYLSLVPTVAPLGPRDRVVLVQQGCWRHTVAPFYRCMGSEPVQPDVSLHCLGKCGGPGVVILATERDTRHAGALCVLWIPGQSWSGVDEAWTHHVAAACQGRGALLLSDMFGGCPCVVRAIEERSGREAQQVRFVDLA